MQLCVTTKRSGFSLIELLVAVAILGILASIALPSYSHYVSKGKIITAQSDLVALSLNFENQYQRVLAYPASEYDNTAEIRIAFGKWIPASEVSAFSFSSADASTSAYTLRATGLGSGGISGCVITLTSTGVQSIADCDEYSSGEWL